jgi:hypothetical protein
MPQPEPQFLVLQIQPQDFFSRFGRNHPAQHLQGIESLDLI